MRYEICGGPFVNREFRMGKNSWLRFLTPALGRKLRGPIVARRQYPWIEELEQRCLLAAWSFLAQRRRTTIQRRVQ